MDIFNKRQILTNAVFHKVYFSISNDEQKKKKSIENNSLNSLSEYIEMPSKFVSNLLFLKKNS